MNKIIRAEMVEAKAEPTYRKVVQNLVEKAQRGLERHGDDKTFVYLKELCLLMGARGTILGLNQKSVGEGYNHLVLYEGYRFINHSEFPITLGDVIRSLR